MVTGPACRFALHMEESRCYLVVSAWVHKDPLSACLSAGGETIETTPEHPFYTADGRWTAAGDLHVGDTVRKADGEYGIVEAIEFVHQSQPMYNLTVITAHTYFVGDGQWLVHNACPPIKIDPKWKAHAFDDPRCRSGCEYVADRIQELIGGERKIIRPIAAPRLGGIGKGGQWHHGDWAYHVVVVKGGKVFDAFTGHQGMLIDEYKKLWRYVDAIDFGF